jgi:N-acetylmuramoyl-L-alanine amidase
VRRSLFYSFLIFAVLASALLAHGIPARRLYPVQQQSTQQSPPQEASPPQQNTSPQTESPAEPPSQQIPSTQTPPPPPVHLGPVIVLDPGHGGTDPGARGTSGIAEKDVVLQFARALRAELERLGYRVIMTRNDDSDPSYDDRAALANAYRDAVFVSLHVSSTGKIGTARAYYYQVSTSAPAFGSTSPAPSGPSAPILWEDTQRPFAEPSRRLANLVQIELTHRFAGSPNAPTPVAVRSLRSVGAPAVAVEVSSVAGADSIALTSLSGPLASSLARGVAAFRPINPVVTGLP